MVFEFIFTSCHTLYYVNSKTTHEQYIEFASGSLLKYAASSDGCGDFAGG